MTEQAKYIDTGTHQEEIRVKREGGIERREHIVTDKTARRRQIVNTLNNLVWLFTGILESIIILRVLLKFMAANPQNPFARLIYNLTDLFLWPFQGLIANPSAEGMVLEITAIFAMLVYLLAAWGVVSIIQLFNNQSGTKTISVQEYSE